ncbi:MAG TPA: acyl-CoA ligase (AMP-forming), exosortase A system-associated [Rhodocyclaceae bacterium]|nr:acyl-CoA ligase (AMP-forming), exosortase A system-associated [Rhodocyclaceae bacterium]HUY02658.1 acyl-CoA ligase (AMP-forming), exosortase A system-associated [Rhodocyclaceae bacterium]
MESTCFLDELISCSADRTPTRIALISGESSLDYATLAEAVAAFAAGVGQMDIGRQERIGIYLEKRNETVIASFGAAAAGAVFVPLNPLLKPEQVGYILRDCNVRMLVTSPERLTLLGDVLKQCRDLRHVVVTSGNMVASEQTMLNGITTTTWSDLLATPPCPGHRVIDTDMAAILYTSGSTGQPKGVVLSHRNMVAGAKSVAGYLDNNADDTLLAALPLSFDAGFSQLTTAFHVGARVVLINYLLPRDVLNAVVKERVTGLTAVPPLWIQMSQLDWPETVTDHLRYIANTGGRMPLDTLKVLRGHLPRTRPFLMYGLTEAFRSTYLPPEEVERRPDSIGKAIPNAEILVLRDDGTPCAPNEPGELVHRGAMVGMGYWNDPEKTAERYKALPGRESGLVLPEIAVFSGDTVRMDEEGFLYFIGRRDEMIKSSGYRISPTEIEEVLYGSQLVGEAAAFGVPHPTLGQAVVVVATPKPDRDVDAETLLAACRVRLPAYMQPARIDIRPGPLPRNPNGKIDRKSLSLQFEVAFT